MDQLSYLDDLMPLSAEDYQTLNTPEIPATNLDIFECLKEYIASGIGAYWLSDKCIRYVEAKTYSAVYIANDSNTLLRIKAGGKRPYISIPRKYANLIPSDLETHQIKSDVDFIRIDLNAYNWTQELFALVEEVADSVIMNYVSDFACCGIYKDCTSAKRCLRGDDPFYLGCYYRKNLRHGKIYLEEQS